MIKLCKVNEITLEDGRVIHFKDVPLSAASTLIEFSETKDTSLVAQILKGVLCEPDGSPLAQLKDYNGKQLADVLPADEAMTLFNAISDASEDSGN